MKIVCVGQSLAALYFSIRIRTKLSGCDVTIYDGGERHALDALPVLLANPLRSMLAFADDDIAAAVRQRIVTADGIDLRLDGERTILPNANYSFVNRLHLVATLRDRARACGCTLLPGVPDEAELHEADLVVGRLPDDAARPQQSPTSLRYMLFRTPNAPRQLGFYVRRVPGGIVHAFHFPDTENLGCLLVETTAEVVSCSGLNDSAGIDTTASLPAALFEPDCGPVLAMADAASGWCAYSELRTPVWHAGKNVLFGPAAYASHGSIGLADYHGLEDAECLAGLLTTHVRPAALEAFEKTRRPTAESLQRASEASRVFCEHVDQYIDMPRARFDYAFMTRSLRIDHQTMQRLAPDTTVEAEYLVAGPPQISGKCPPPMFAPITLRGLTIPNRIVLSPMCMYNATDGTPGDFHLVHYASRAQGGAGLIITEMTNVLPEGRISPYCTGLYSPDHLPAWKRIVDFVHTSTPAKIGMQLGHAGRKGSVGPRWKRDLGGETWETLSASPVPFDKGRPTPREVTRSDMDRIVAAYVSATAMSEAAGFDMLELHCAHGYLLSSFISPLSNVRTDEYGGTLERRMRFPLEVFAAIRRAWPEHKPIAVRISATDWLEGGTTVDDAIEIALMFAAAGNDILAVSTGGVTSHQRPNVGRLYQATFSDQIRNAAKVPTMTVGGVASYGDANMMIASGRADMCALARGHLYNPYFTLHAAQRQGYHDIEWPKEYGTATSLRMRDFC